MFDNNIFLGSGIFDFEKNKSAYENCGAIFTKTITKESRSGNKGEVFFENQEGIYNRIGLTNEGIDEFCESTFPKLQKFNKPVFVSLLANKDFNYCLEKASKLNGLFGVEINLSCPNTEEKMKIPRDFYKCENLKFSIKMPGGLGTFNNILQDFFSDDYDKIEFIHISNTIPITKLDKMEFINYGYSGEILRQRNLRIIKELRELYSDKKIIGCGGIRSQEHAKEYLMAGADFISIVSEEILRPGSLKLIKEWLDFE